MRIEKRNDGVVIYYNNNPILVNKGLNFAVPGRSLKIFGIDKIPTKEVLKAILTDNDQILISNIEKLGIDYRFKYTTISGIKNDSIKLGEEYLSEL